MTTYYKQLNEFGELVLLLTYNFTPNIINPLIVKIAKEEYEMLLMEVIAEGEVEQEALIEIEQKAQAYDILVGKGE